MDTNLQISLPVPLREWLERQVISKGFHSPSEVVEDILRREQELEYRATIDKKLKQSIASGESNPLDAAEWARLRSLGQQLAASRPAE